MPLRNVGGDDEIGSPCTYPLCGIEVSKEIHQVTVMRIIIDSLLFFYLKEHKGDLEPLSRFQPNVPHQDKVGEGEKNVCPSELLEGRTE